MVDVCPGWEGEADPLGDLASPRIRSVEEIRARMKYHREMMLCHLELRDVAHYQTERQLANELAWVLGGEAK